MDIGIEAVMKELLFLVGGAALIGIVVLGARLRYMTISTLALLPIRLREWTVKFWKWLKGSGRKPNGLLATLTIILLVVSLINVVVMMIGADEVGYQLAIVKAEIAAMGEDSLPSILKNCQIKGNINRNGDKIYHTPQSPHYYKTNIHTRYGEQWFCTVEEAEAAGWRAPYR